MVHGTARLQVGNDLHDSERLLVRMVRGNRHDADS
jgi:hypothetical protein